MFVQIYINMNTNMKKWNLRKHLFCPLTFMCIIYILHFYVFHKRLTIHLVMNL